MVVTGFLNLLPMYLIHLSRVQSSYLLCILCICVADCPVPDSSKELARLVRYLMLRASAWFYSTFIPNYADWSSVVISASFTLDVTC